MAARLFDRKYLNVPVEATVEELSVAREGNALSGGQFALKENNVKYTHCPILGKLPS